MQHQQDYPRDVNPAITEARLGMLIQDVGEIKFALRELTSAITRMAVVEERLAAMVASQERAFVALEALEERVFEIEARLPEYGKTSIWVDRGIYAALAAAGMYFLKKLGIV